MTLTHRLAKIAQTVWRAWDDFWFRPLDPYGACAFRFVFGLGLTAFYFNRFLYFDLYYSERGLLPYHWLLELFPQGYEAPVQWHVLLSNEKTAYMLHLVLILGVALLTIGILNRFWKVLLFMLALSFHFRNFTILYGADMVSIAWLFYLTFIPTTAHFNPFARFAKSRAKTAASKTDALGSIGIRLIQLQLCIIYAYSGFEKAKGLSWWRGDALWYVLGNGQLVPLDLSFVHHFPGVIALIGFLTLLWEAYFPLLVLFRRVRNAALVFGLFLHLGIGLLMNLPFFSYFMTSAYLLFVDRQDLERWAARLRGSRRAR